MTTKKARIAAVAGATGVAAVLAVAGAAPAAAETAVERPDSFTSSHTVAATPDQVVGPDGAMAPGEPGAMGTFNFMINSDSEIICYDITLNGVTPPYESGAKTATHIHETAAGESGPPRLAFPNPEGDGVLSSSGCLQGPFTTGLEGDDGVDTGEGFSLKEIEANPAGFSADTHTANFVPGAVRGQLTMLPAGGADTGVAMTSPVEEAGSVLTLTLGAAGAVAVGAVFAVRSRTRTA
ncbi:CHRD domain-containing protein [Arthrobacter flavus]|uniref:CHRD domain-containing protein n=1 Tax=Arthrobacter flavus TaxID=95172 RepID=A0ABW4Q4W6_9MICC